MQMIQELLAREYRARVVRVEAIRDFGDGGIHRAELDDGDAWIVRVFSPARPLERVRGDAAVLLELETRDVAAERVVPAADGSSTSVLGDHGVLVTRLVPGSQAPRTAATYRALGETLGRVQSIESEDELVRRRAGSMPQEDLTHAREDLESVVDIVSPDAWALLGRLRDAIDSTSECEDLPRALVHPDCHSANAIVTPDGRVVLCDWDGAGFGPRVAALGILLSDAGLENARSAAEAYASFTRLEPRELERLPDAIRFRPLVLCVRRFAKSVRRRASPPDDWWRWTQAEEVAELVAAVLRG